MTQVALDTAVLVALIDSQDKWHSEARSLAAALRIARAEVVFFDPVVNEVVSVLARRLAEQRRGEQFVSLLDSLEQLVPSDRITWISPDMPRVYAQVMQIVRAHGGELNFHDALIALACRELAIEHIASFDRDFDRIDWLKRFGAASDVPSAT